MKLIEQLFNPSQFTLLTAPVASGKTKLVVEFYRENQYKVIFVSPLRALANEVFIKLESVEKNIFLAGGKVPLDDCMVNFLQCRKAFFIATMELLSEDFLEACAAQNEKIIFILDEFHLFYYWGESFRPILHDRFLAILDTQAPVLGITATMSSELLVHLKEDLKYHNETWFHIDYGNHQLHRHPKELHCFQMLKPELFHRAMWRELRQKNHKDVYLIFCSYRSEVDELVARSRRMGLRSIGCVGGEVESFLEELKNHNEEVDCIFSTTTLSHGVNLPEIKKVFINYEVKNYDFWLQMIGRGGRRGSDYEVYTFDAFHSSKKQLLTNRVKIYLSDFVGLEV
ncbi:MAG: DEAD/DEAH box helicase [Bacteriovorax sp.]|nr:DEAD/DEAH box helicase [Bacteriovorax sp.]